MNLDKFGTGVTGVAAAFAGDTSHPDNIIFDVVVNKAGGTGYSPSGFGHPTCLFNPDPSTLPPVR